MRRYLRIALTVIVLSALVVMAVQWFQFRSLATDDQSEPAVDIETAVVTVRDLAVTVGATGSISPARQIRLAFEITAPVREVLVQPGQSVQAGQALARLDTADLEAALMSAQINLDSQLAAYEALIAPPREADIAAARAALNVALAQAGAASLGPDPNQVEIARLQAELARNQLWQLQLQRDLPAAATRLQQEELGKFGIEIPDPPDPADNVPPQLKQADYGVLIADANLAAATNQPPDTAGLAAANAQIVSAQSQLDRLLNGPDEREVQIAQTQIEIARLAVAQAEANLAKATLTAPFDGVVTAVDLVVGELPPANGGLEIVDPSGFYVDVAVDETDVVDLQVGQRADLRLDALPEAQIGGVVTRVASTPVRAGQLVTYTVRITLDPTLEPVRVGMTATATVTVQELRSVPVLPNRFIRVDRATQRAFVTVERPGGYEDVEVKLGLRNETDAQIVSGVEAGQRVVLLPRQTFNPIPGPQ